jgi:hypothetical protein
VAWLLSVESGVLWRGVSRGPGGCLCLVGVESRERGGSRDSSLRGYGVNSSALAVTLILLLTLLLLCV